MCEGLLAVALTRKSTVEFALLTDVGRVRVQNEDACAADEAAGLFVVCDGMGGAAGGEIASNMAARIFLEQARQLGLDQSPHWRLQQAVVAANRTVFDKAHRERQLRGMGTTLVGLEVDTETGHVWTVNVGDSRCYRLRGGELSLLTEDHSLVKEQLRSGEITEEEAAVSPLRNVITRAVGSHSDVAVDVEEHQTEEGDLYLLCSDGLIRDLDDEDITGVLLAGREDLQACAAALVHLANECGGGDNITVVLVGITGSLTVGC